MEETALLEQLQNSSGARRLQLLNNLAYELIASDLRRARTTAEEACALCQTLYPQIFAENGKQAEQPGERTYARRTMLAHAAQSFANLGSILLRFDEFDAGVAALDTCMKFAAADSPLRIRVLNSLGIAHVLCNNDHEQAQAVLEEALRIAERHHDDKGRAVTLTTLGKTLTAAGRFEEATTALRESLDIHRRVDYPEAAADALNELGHLYCIIGDTGTALQMLLEGLHIREKLQHSREIALSLMSVGNVYQAVGEYTEALQYQMRSLGIFEAVNDARGMADVLSNIGNIYRRTEDITTALHYYDRSVEMRRQLCDKQSEATLLNNTGTAYAGLGEYAKAHECLQRSVVLHEMCGDQQGVAIALLNIGLVYCDEKGFNAARGYAEKALDIFKAIGSRHDEAAALLAHGRIVLDSGNPEMAIVSLQEALAIAEAIQARPLIPEVHERLALAHEQSGDCVQALQHYRSFHVLREQVFSEESNRRLQALNIHYEVERSRKEAEVQKLNRERLERDVDLKNRELTATTMLLAQKNDVLRELYDQVKEMKNMPENRRTVRLRELLLTLENHLTSHQTWEAFEQHFTQIHGTFYTALLERCRDLSPAELKVCALIKLNLTMKEIAALLAVTVMTIKKHRYNIRKKIGLEEGENLSTFLAGL